LGKVDEIDERVLGKVDSTNFARSVGRQCRFVEVVCVERSVPGLLKTKERVRRMTVKRRPMTMQQRSVAWRS
jgi:hypothetical protein